MSTGDAWAAGNNFGAGLEDKISGAFNLGGGVDYGLEGINTGFNLDDITANTGQTAANTGAAADALSTSTEELGIPAGHCGAGGHQPLYNG